MLADGVKLGGSVLELRTDFHGLGREESPFTSG